MLHAGRNGWCIGGRSCQSGGAQQAAEMCRQKYHGFSQILSSSPVMLWWSLTNGWVKKLLCIREPRDFWPLIHEKWTKVQLRKMVLLTLEYRTVRGELIAVFHYLQSVSREDAEFYFSDTHRERARHNDFKLQQVFHDDTSETDWLKYMWNLCPWGISKVYWTRPWEICFDIEICPA